MTLLDALKKRKKRENERNERGLASISFFFAIQPGLTTRVYCSAEIAQDWYKSQRHCFDTPIPKVGNAACAGGGRPASLAAGAAESSPRMRAPSGAARGHQIRALARANPGLGPAKLERACRPVGCGGPGGRRLRWMPRHPHALAPGHTRHATQIPLPWRPGCRREREQRSRRLCCTARSEARFLTTVLCRCSPFSP